MRNSPKSHILQISTHLDTERGRYRPFGKRGVVAFLVAFFELQRRRHAVPELRRVHVRGIQSRVCEGARGSTQDRNSSFPGGWERASQERPRRSAGRGARGSQSPDPWSGPNSCFFLINAKKKLHTFRASCRIWNLEILLAGQCPPRRTETPGTLGFQSGVWEGRHAAPELRGGILWRLPVWRLGRCAWMLRPSQMMCEKGGKG